jgi:hypothetical protein
VVTRPGLGRPVPPVPGAPSAEDVDAPAPVYGAPTETARDVTT